ncbi:MAG: CopG family ribbon-helix-helix protein [Gammaproteobacteria bacterium]
MKATTVRLEDDVLGRIDGLAKTMSRSRAWVIKEAIDRLLDYEEWYADSVQQAIGAAERGDTVPHEHVMEDVRRRIDHTKS